MLKTTKIKLELITDPDMYIFFEKGTRGAIFYISNRYSKANNKYLKSYANNLNGYAMPKFLPTNGFKWIDSIVPEDVFLKLILNIELHNDYPLAPDKIEIKQKYCLSINLKLLIYAIFLLVMLKN